KGLGRWGTGRLMPWAGFEGGGHTRGVIDSSAWVMQSKPVAATMFLGSDRVTSGSISAMVGMRRREMMPVLALIERRLKIAMPVVSEPVPQVVGHAMCERTAPGTFCPPPIGALT